eukprot:TRINITY_DN2037_c0_g1_i7.p2 TRINITY_DN2037_c0_g1~~TRINITY_DN2037_c0_g1_i7.p2  ORF type:complete len:125 (+),score=17.14 TRINITY_DN2037_c0_g1_i7:1075-1449(+)
MVSRLITFGKNVAALVGIDDIGKPEPKIDIFFGFGPRYIDWNGSYAVVDAKLNPLRSAINDVKMIATPSLLPSDSNTGGINIESMAINLYAEHSARPKEPDAMPTDISIHATGLLWVAFFVERE